MQSTIGFTNFGTGRVDYPCGRCLGHQPGHKQPEKKKVAAAGKRNDFLTSRIVPVSTDLLMKDCTGTTTGNLTTSENLDYLYRSALRYAGLMNVRLPFRIRKGVHPRINIAALYKALDGVLPENINIEKREGRLHFCLYRFHEWPDHTLFWIPIDFIEKISVPLRRILREFIRRFIRHHGLDNVTETGYYEMALEELDDWESREPDASPQEIRKYKRLAASYTSGKISKALKRMEGKPFCSGLEEKLRECRTEIKAEQELLSLIREGMELITPGNPYLVWYDYDWAYEESPDFPPIDLSRQVMLVYSVDDALTENMGDYFNSDYRETYTITPVTYKYLTPETDKLFQMDNYPERLSEWMQRFIQHINTQFKKNGNE